MNSMNSVGMCRTSHKREDVDRRGKDVPLAGQERPRIRELTMMTNRSNHMPMVTATDTMKMTIGLRRAAFCKTCGESTLQLIVVGTATRTGRWHGL